MPDNLSKYEHEKGTSIPLAKRHSLFAKEVWNAIAEGKDPNKAYLGASGWEFYFSEDEKRKLLKWSRIERVFGQELSIDDRHQLAWTGYVRQFGQLSAHRFFRRPSEGTRSLGIGRLEFNTFDANEVIHTDNKTGLVGTREDLARRAQWGYFKAGPPLQSEGVVIGAPVYGVLRLMGRSHSNAIGWAELASSAGQILSGGSRKFNADRGSNSRPTVSNDIRFLDNVKRGDKTYPKPNSRHFNSHAPGSGGFFVPPPPKLINQRPFFIKYKEGK
ncbi:hypothetical protein J1N09_01775 [Aureitalea sp. L0-47]|uniref:hypothetical protein n=1 Tax=Aureitalea sp. L0-47 TaxID=2816962 RepID=UPI002238FF43|nr:hypothetical protein [Aureitalea sp. L0-47]MCW5518550.1 hypothetical protein [Aureitalea sp. L0-47]